MNIHLHLWIKTIIIYLVTFIIFFHNKKISFKRIVIFTSEFYLSLLIIHIPIIANIYYDVFNYTKQATNLIFQFSYAKSIVSYILQTIISLSFIVIIVYCLRHIYKMIINKFHMIND